MTPIPSPAQLPTTGTLRETSSDMSNLFMLGLILIGISLVLLLGRRFV
jgi:LPXTG-motif cell wall-anchored protein